MLNLKDSPGSYGHPIYQIQIFNRKKILEEILFTDTKRADLLVQTLLCLIKKTTPFYIED
jgi:hypothetical protein